MSVSGISAYSAYSARTANVSANGNNAASAANAANATVGSNQSSGDSVQTTDFTHMTRKDLIQWVNSKITGGELSLDGSEAFVGMAGRMPVNGAYAGLDDTEQVNFMQTAQNGIARAQQTNNKDTLKQLQAAVSTMQRYQGQITGINLTV